jgi:RNA-binding protein
MLKPKQVAYLRSLSNHIKPVAQIGKDGLSDNLLDTILNYLNKHELMKVSILQNSFVSDEEVKEFVEDACIEYVAKIGRVYIFYMHSDDAKENIELPR